MKWHRMSSLLPLAIVMLGASAKTASAQSTGWVAVVGYTGSLQSGRGVTITHTYVQGASGLEEVNSEEFTPGAHTFARVEGIYDNCTAVATNVTFTITANKWTFLEVPMTFTTCQVSIDMNVTGDHNEDGVGTVLYYVPANVGPSLDVASCTTVAAGSAFYAWANFHTCTGQAPFHSHVIVAVTPGLHSLTDYTDTVSYLADTTDLASQIGYAFLDVRNPHPNGLNLATDVGITLIGGSYGGFVSTNVFRIVNHGPANAAGVEVASGDIFDPEERGDFRYVLTMTDGSCGISSCALGFLPAGDSTTMTVRMYAVPADPTSNAPENFPTLTPTCVNARVVHHQFVLNDSVPPDPNTANDKADCIHGGSVPVTVALGSSTPSNQTVQSGSTNVPMLQFLLTPTAPQTITGVTVAASGTGNEQVDVSAVRLYLDKNGNGAVDAGDSIISTGTFATNDGTVTLAVNPGLSITTPTSLLVTYSFTLTIAERIGGGIVLAMFPLLILPSFRRRKTLLAMLIVMLTAVAITACGGDSSTGPKPGNGSVTFESTLTGVTTNTGSLSSLAVSGATITVNK
ncbi:MAG: hypothetical protein ABI446_00695 [Gemmatimonadaceae bacterium]